MPKSVANLPVIALLSFLAGSAYAVDQKLIESCDSCHGVKGVSTTAYIPTIAGISETVHEDALKAYLAKERPCREVKYPSDKGKPPSDMCKAVAKLNDAQIEGIAAHYAGLPFVAAKQKTDPAKVANGKTIHEESCDKCHTEGGSDPSEDASILAGQHMDYLRESFKDFTERGREQPKKMKKAVDKLNAEDLEALVHYYGSLQ